MMRVALAVAVVLTAVACRSDATSSRTTERDDTTTVPPAEQPCGDADGMSRHQALGVSPGYAIVSGDAAAAGRELDGIAASGVCWVRIDIDWSRIEPEPGRFEWDDTDRAVEGAVARGMEVLGLLVYTPAWARPEGTSDKYPPEDVSAFRTFADTVARRYAHLGVRTWEIWNEPNLRAFWESGPDPTGYGELLSAASSALRSVDDGAVVITGGLSPASDDADGSEIAPVTFLDALYEAGVDDAFDAVGMHPYSYPLNPVHDVPLNHFVSIMPELRDVMVRHGDDAARIWGTEYGAPTGTSDQAVDPDEQATFLADALEQWERWEWTGPLLVYAWRDRGTDLHDREDNFGLVDHQFRPKPALSVLLEATGASP